MDAIAQAHRQPLLSVIERVHATIAASGAHPSRTVVLLPFLQLVPVASAAWAQLVPNGFSPRFETTMNWAGSAGFVPGPGDLSMDMGRDLLIARALLESAGMGERADLLASRLVEAAWQVAASAASTPPSQRAAWAANARAVISSAMNAPALMLESAIARIALEWAAASSYAGDALLEPGAQDAIDLLIVIEGLRADALTAALVDAMPDKAVRLPIGIDGAEGEIRVHTADDPSDEAERAAACVLRHVDAGVVPVALAAIDRVLTRRVRAMLDARGVAIRDETGWKLSTTRAAAHVMLALRGCTWNASADAVVDWLKNSPAAGSWSVLALERRLRRAGLREWRSLRAEDAGDGAPQRLLDQVNLWREGMQGMRPLQQWLADLRRVLESSGQWSGLESDAAGANVITALRLDEAAALELGALPQAARRIDLHEFTSWVNESLEAANFIPEKPGAEQVVILPLNQLLGRPFAALVIPGCDELRLAISQEPAGIWTHAQREALGLPTRESQEAELRAAWRVALHMPVCDVLWRRTDESGEPLMSSPLVQELELRPGIVAGSDPRSVRELPALPTQRPQAKGQSLPVPQLSASAYEDLRRCPYRFFALRQLGLQEADEIDTEVDKRDFGNWLHRVLSQFHNTLQERPAPADEWAAMLDVAATDVTRAMRLDDGEFLPFTSAWPRVREGYLHWLAKHEATGARFAQAESEHEVTIGSVKLVGRIDRIDNMADGAQMVLDYKTESAETSRSRVQVPTEDTQLAFYAALLPNDTLHAAYVNVGERGKTESYVQQAVVEARDLLIEGLLDDMRRIGEGDKMPALGEGKVCDFCSARGLCRRDFWND